MKRVLELGSAGIAAITSVIVDVGVAKAHAGEAHQPGGLGDLISADMLGLLAVGIVTGVTYWLFNHPGGSAADQASSDAADRIAWRERLDREARFAARTVAHGRDRQNGPHIFAVGDGTGSPLLIQLDISAEWSRDARFHRWSS